MNTPENRARRVLGVETEYALAALGSRRSNAEFLADRLYLEAIAGLRHLPCRASNSLWLTNGGRFYLDCGSHPEFCTPEVDDPVEAARFVLAGDSLLYRLLEQARMKEASRQEWLLFKCNVDYSGMLSTWACHENYGHRANPAALPEDLIPHLVSRLIYTGAGGLNPLVSGIDFCLSPRVYHLSCVTGESSTSQRGIFHMKYEPLSGLGWHRMHVLCGDSVLSHRSIVLKLGTTALVVAMAEAGLHPGKAVRLQDPLQAMRTINSDPHGRVTVSLANDRAATALEIQRHYLHLAESHQDHPLLPRWTGQICALWRATLDQFEQGPQHLMRTLDWAIKFALYQEFLRTRGWDPPAVQENNRRLETELERTATSRPPKPASSRDLLADFMFDWEVPTSLLPSRRSAQRRLSAPMVEFLKARDALCELEIRFSQLGPQGLFHRLDEAGQLDHRLPELTRESIEAAVDQPPSRGRARVRGDFVRDHEGQPGYACDWFLFQTPMGCIEVPDPCQDHLPQPNPASPPHPYKGRLRPQLADLWMNQASQCWTQGMYERAFDLLSNIESQRAALSTRSQQQHWLLLARVQSRRGFWQEARLYLQQWAATRSPGGLEVPVEFIAASRLQSLVPAQPETSQWLAQGERWLAEHAAPEPEVLFSFRTHQALANAQSGHAQEACQQLQALIHSAQTASISPRSHARVKAEFAGLLCRLGKWAEAETFLGEAKTIQVSEQFLGDVVEFYFPNAIKHQWYGDPEHALEMAAAARATASQIQHQMALARIILLQARFSKDLRLQFECRAQLETLRHDIPALQACPLLVRILNHWPAWTSGEPSDGEPDPFWGL